jgi:hypothetical protein
MEEKMENEFIRERARALGIKNWHNRKIPTLVKLIKEKEVEVIEGSSLSLPLDAVMNVLDSDGKERMLEYLQAVDNLVGHEKIVEWLENAHRLGKIVDQTTIQTAYKHYVSQSGDKYCKPETFAEALNNVFTLHQSSDWEIYNNLLFFGKKQPKLSALWHIQTWIKVSSVFNKEKAMQVLAVVLD